MQNRDSVSSQDPLAQIKSQILQNLPTQRFRHYLEYQEECIEGGCINSVKHHLCCPKVDPGFQKAFPELCQDQKVKFYKKTIILGQEIVKHQSRVKQSTFEVEQRPTVVLFESKVFQGGAWRRGRLIINPTDRSLQIRDRTYSASDYLLEEYREQGQRVIRMVSLRQSPTVLLGRTRDGFQEMLWQVQRIFNDTMKDYLIELIESQSQPDEEGPPLTSQRMSLSLQHKMEEIADALNVKPSYEKLNYLRIKHRVQPLESEPRNILVPKSRTPYCLEGQWQISKSGQLVVCNQQKLQNQSGVVKYIIKRIFSGARIFSISLPVQVFHQESNLSLLLHSCRHAPLILEPAAKLQTPLGRFLKVVKFALSCPPCYIRCDKPFNPLLGETYQTTVAGALFYGEQISHHPPISAILIKGVSFTLHASLEAQIQFGFNSATGNNTGWIYAEFKDGQKVQFTNSPGKMSGLIFGERSLNLIDSVHFVDKVNRLFCELFFGRSNFTGADTFKDSIEGKVWKVKPGVSLDKPSKTSEKDMEHYYGLIQGRWLSKVYFEEELLCDQTGAFAPELEQCQGLLPSDTTFRQDVRIKKLGNLQECQIAKQQLQQIQRRDRRLRENHKKR